SATYPDGSLPIVVDNSLNPYTFTVTYTDDTLISRATIGNQPDDDVLVSKVGGGFSVNATFVSADSAVDAQTINATYSFVPPGGGNRLFNINDGVTGTAITVNLTNLAMTSASAASSGGAILDQDEIISLTDSSITNSKASGNGAGIAVLATGGTVTLTRVVVSG